MKTIIAILLNIVCLQAFAASSGVTYQGRILKPDGSPLAGQFTQFKMQIRTPDSQACLMYEEVQSQDMRNTSGAFSLTINDGNGSRIDTSGLTLDRIFANRGTYNLDVTTCSSGSGVWVPNVSDGRNLVVLFKDETMASWEPIPAQKINFVPYAFESKQIAGFTADSLFRVVNGSGDPMTGLAPLSNAEYTALLALANGSSSTYTKAGELRGSAVPAINSGEVLGWNGTSWVSTPVTPGVNSVTTTMLQGGAVTGAKLDPAISISTSGTVASAITTTRDFKIFAASPSTFYVGMAAPALAASYTLTWPMTAGTSGQFLMTDGTGTLTWTTPASAGITALTGDVTATGPGSAAATVASVGGSTAVQVHTAELLANAATSANTVSTLVRRDGTGAFAAGAVTQTSSVYKDSGANTVTVQAPTAVGSSYVLKLPTGIAAANGQVLTSDTGGNLSWTTLSGAPTGSAGGDLSGTYPNPGVATVGTSSAANVHAAELLANAATSSNIASAIVKRSAGGDFTANVGTFNGVALNNAGSVVSLVNPTGAAYTLTLPTGTGTSGQVLSTDGSGITSWTTPIVGLTSTTGFAQGGNSFGAVATLGTNDSNDLRLRTNGATALTIVPSGSVGIGTTSPSEKLHAIGRQLFQGSVGGSRGFLFDPQNNSIEATGSDPIMLGNVLGRQLSIGSGARYTMSMDGNGDTATGFVGLSSPGKMLQIGNLNNNPGEGPSTVVAFMNAGSVGIGTTVPTTKLEVAGSMRVGDGGETCAAAITGAIRYNGGNLQFCNGTPPWTTLGVAGTGMTSLTGDVTATGPGASAATVVQVGGYSAANVAAGATLANAATNLNTASTIMKRDAAGKVDVTTLAAATVATSALRLKSGIDYIEMRSPILPSGTYTLTFPNAVATSAGQALTSDTSGNLSWTTLSGAPTGAAGGDLSGTYPNPGVALVGTSSAANVHAAELLANAATAANTVSTIVKRDGSGNFTATDITSSSVKADTLKLNNAGSVVNVVNPIGAAYTLTLPTGTGSSGQVLSTNGSGITSWIAAGTGSQWTTQAPGINYMSGNVGIGTTSPSSLLEVNGRVAFGGSFANIDPLASPDLTSLQNSGKTWVGWNRVGGQGETDFVANRGAGVGGGFGFWDYSNAGVMTQLMYMNGSNGRVGVNTTSAGSTFSVNGGASIGSYHTTASPANGLIVSGNVGIGTTAPSGILEVQGGMSASGGGSPILMQAQSANQFAYAMGGGVDIRGGNGNYGAPGGTSTFAGGFPGGAANLLGGSAYNGQTGGAVNIIAGDGNAGPIGADVNITSGLGNYNSSAGHVRINGGYSYNGGNGNGGSIIMTAGAGQGTGTGGNFQFLSGNVGIGTAVPTTALDVKGGIRAGSETEVNITCNSANEGIQRYNRSTHFMEYCNGTNWMQPLVQAVGSTANVTASGPPVSANVYTISSASADFTPTQGSVAATHNGVWPANGASVPGCIDMPVSGAGSLIYDLGSNKSVGNVYFSSTGYSNTYDFAFSTDGVTFVSSSMIGGGYDGQARYQTSGLAPAQTARYVRVRYTNGTGSYPYWCQVAFGP